MKKSVVLIFMFTCFFCVGQKLRSQISDRDKTAYFKLIYDKCPTADILELESKGDYVEIEYLCEGKYYEIGISDYRIIFLETMAEDSIIPQAKIQKKLTKKYQGWLLDEISLISTNDTSFLKVEIMKDGLEQNLFFTTDGKWYKSKSIVVSDKWTIDKLSGSSLFENTAYDFLSPDSTFELPEILREISGITLSDDEKTIFCVQDELGAVFEYDCLDDKVKNRFRFTDIGDFEAVTLRGDELFVMRSDGRVFSFNYKKKKEISQFMLSINAFNFESLIYDEVNKEFLTISKDAMLNTLESKRMVYKFPYNKPEKATLDFEVDVHEINETITSNLTEMESNDLLFNPSEIAIHPMTREIYILSASDRVLTVYDKGGLKAVYPLPAELYYKPEGLTFYKNGDMLISSEGDKRGLIKGSIMFFKYKK